MLAGMAGGGADLPFDDLPAPGLRPPHAPLRAQPALGASHATNGVQHFATLVASGRKLSVDAPAVAARCAVGTMTPGSRGPGGDARRGDGRGLDEADGARRVARGRAPSRWTRPSSPNARTPRRSLIEIAVAIRLYELDHKGARSRQRSSDLLQTTSASYPEGYLEGGDSVPKDAWGRAFVYGKTAAGYALRSVGPNGDRRPGRRRRSDPRLIGRPGRARSIGRQRVRSIASASGRSDVRCRAPMGESERHAPASPKGEGWRYRRSDRSRRNGPLRRRFRDLRRRLTAHRSCPCSYPPLLRGLARTWRVRTLHRRAARGGARVVRGLHRGALARPNGDRRARVRGREHGDPRLDVGRRRAREHHAPAPGVPHAPRRPPARSA